MKILVNGVWRDIAAADLISALAELGYADAVIATALNGEFVSADSRASTHLADGDRIEIVAPMQGG